MPVNPIPDGYHSITPYLMVADVAAQIEFIESVFGGKVKLKMDSPGGRIMHAEVQVGNSIIMMGEPMEGFPAKPATLYHYCEDVDSVFARATARGAEVVQEPATQFYGDRTAAVNGPGDIQWWIATHVKDVSNEELERLAREGGQQE